MIRIFVKTLVVGHIVTICMAMMREPKEMMS